MIERHNFKFVNRIAAVVVLVATAGAAAMPVLAQTWTWPWDTETRQAPQPAPQFRPQPAERPPATFDPAANQPQGDICLQLEQRLANEVNRGRGGGDERANIARAVKQSEQQVRTLEAQLERSNCWDEFFFQKTLRNTRTCVGTYQSLQSERQRVQDLRAQFQQFSASSSQSLQDDILRALARNRCGAAYEQQARRANPNNPFASFFQDYDSNPADGDRNTYRGLPFATYRTLCVRLCDGYYFPVSFSTLPNYFERDAQACQSKCAAPVALYYHQNPGGSIEQMVSTADNTTYKTLQSAFRYRKEFVQGCSCKTAEYVPSGIPIEKSTASDAPRRFSPIR